MRKLILTKKWFTLIVLSTFIFTIGLTQNDDWEAPAEYQSMKNPMEANTESIDLGKELYATHCKACHGKFGEGDGPKAEELDSSCGDFTEEKFGAQSDGSIFYKTKIGREDMPSFGKKIPDEEDIWHVVNYIRTLAE